MFNAIIATEKWRRYANLSIHIFASIVHDVRCVGLAAWSDGILADCAIFIHDIANDFSCVRILVSFQLP